MKYEAQLANGARVDLGAPYQVRVNKAEDAPADDFFGVFPGLAGVEEMTSITVYDGKEVFFYGPLDEQTKKCGPSGVFLQIFARSLAGLLLDNEARPQVYTRPSLGLVFEKHARPYGFLEIFGDNRTFSGELVVQKGMSEWDVLESFCRDFLLLRPRASTAKIFAQKDLPRAVHTFGEGGVPFFEIYERHLRHKLIHEVWVRAGAQTGYSLRVKNLHLEKRGVVRRRFLNATNDVKTPAKCAEMLIEGSKKASWELQLKCPGAHAVEVGDGARVSSEIFSSGEILWVKKVKYTLTPSGEMTEITLRRP